MLWTWPLKPSQKDPFAQHHLRAVGYDSHDGMLVMKGEDTARNAMTKGQGMRRELRPGNLLERVPRELVGAFLFLHNNHIVRCCCFLLAGNRRAVLLLEEKSPSLPFGQASFLCFLWEKTKEVGAPVYIRLPHLIRRGASSSKESFLL